MRTADRSGPHPPRRRRLLLSLAIASVCLPALAHGQEGEGTEPRRRDPARIWLEPTFTPYTARPTLRNPGAIQALSGELLPGGTDGFLSGATGEPLPLGTVGAAPARDEPLEVAVYVFITRTGEVGNTRIDVSSGRQHLDLAALRMTWRMEFEPATSRGRAVPVWARIGFSFWG